LPRGRWLAFAYLYPATYLLAAYAIVWASGFGAFDTTMLAEDAGKRYALPAGLSPVLVATVATATVGVLVEIGRSLGEELGWRGFLSPALSAKRGLEFGGLASGAIWGLWHFPLLIAIGFGTLPAGYALACFLVSTTSLGYVCAWLRWRSRSVWPAVVVHSVHNALLYPVLEMATAPDGDRTQFATGETGFALALVNVVGALAVWRSRRGSSAIRTA
jgi:membrane protease YdiL (CAAX protease family)